MGFGTGHNSVGYNLEKEFKDHTNVSAVEVVDLLDLIPRSLTPLLQNGYYNMLTKFPSIYSYLYDRTNKSKLARYVSGELLEKSGLILRKKINAILREFKPTKIVTTHPFGLLFCSTKLRIPSIGVVTDYEVHPMWLARVPNVLCISKNILSKEDKAYIEWKEGTRVAETGIPVSANYHEYIDHFKARDLLGIKNLKPIVLIMGGGAGLGPMEDLVKDISKLSFIQFVILTGKNKDLYNALQSKIGPNIMIEKFRSDVHLFMSSASLLITKPGGVTVTEAITKKVPMMLFKAFPGQEETNQKFILKNKLGMVTSPKTIVSQLEKFFRPDSRLNKRFSKGFDCLNPLDSSKEVVSETLRFSQISKAKLNKV